MVVIDKVMKTTFTLNNCTSCLVVKLDAIGLKPKSCKTAKNLEIAD